MSAIESETPAAKGPGRGGVLGQWFAAWRRRRVQRITLGELMRMDARLLCDLGIEPRDLIDAIEGRREARLLRRKGGP